MLKYVCSTSNTSTIVQKRGVMYNKELHERAEKLYDQVNNAPPVSFNFNHEGGKVPRSEKINFRLTKIYYDMLVDIANDNRATMSDVLNEILYYFWIDYKNAKEDLRHQKEVWFNQFDNLSEQEQKEIIKNSITLAQSKMTSNLLNKIQSEESEDI